MNASLTPRQAAHRHWRQAVITAHKTRTHLHLRWREAFENFVADMGEPPPGARLKRRDANGPFTPENCMWG